MPSKSKAQRNLMAAAAHNSAFAKKVGVPQSVAKEFNQADKGKKFKSGGHVANLKKLFKGKESYGEELKEGKAIKSGKISPEQYAKGEEMEKKMKSGGCCGAKKMAIGGAATSDEGNDLIRVEPKKQKTKAFSKGGSASSRADGIATKGKTKGRFV